MRRAAVTGATGFLGRHLVRQLVAEGWEVRILARRDVIHPLWRDLSVDVVQGDLNNGEALARLCDGAGTVIHGAGLIKACSRQDFDAVNVEGARRVAQAARGPVLLISSLAAREPHLSDYAGSKRAGESAAREILGDRLGVVRPPALYGPGDSETLPLFQLAASSPILPVLNPQSRLALMHATDAARQIAALAAYPMGFEVALSDARPNGYSWTEIMQAAAEVFGRTPRLARVPDVALKLAGLAGILGGQAILGPGKAREILHRDWSVRPDEQTIKLPAPLFDLARGFLDTVQGYRASGVLFSGKPEARES